MRVNTNSWITHINDTDPPGYVIHPNCPLDYCRSPTKNVNMYLNLPDGSDAQCAYNRSGVLCGGCQEHEIPENTSLVSAFFWLRCEPQCIFIKPITVEIQHCSTKQDLSKLKIVRAFCNQKSLPYKFKQLKGGSFNADTFYGAIDMKGFSGVCVVEENPDSERMYYNQLFYRSCLSHQQRHEIHIIFIWNTELHLNVM